MAASSTNAARLARARVRGTHSLRVFQNLLDSAARPGTVARLDDTDHDIPHALVPALALVDLDHAVCVLGDRDSHGDEGVWSALVSAATGARLADVAEADVVVCLRPPSPDEVRSLRRGSAQAPERGARLVVAVRSIEPHAGHDTSIDGPRAAFTLRGPGVASSRTLTLHGVEPAVIAAIAETNRHFPAGVDTWIVADDGSLMAIPRSSRIAVHTTLTASEKGDQ